jgi:V-type H+-transporting ATPase subunit C
MVYWLISVPCESDKKDYLYTKISKTLKSNKIEHHAFHVPTLKVGTLDSLMALSDDLQRYDQNIENFTMKALKSLKDVSEIEDDKFTPEINVDDHKSKKQKFNKLLQRM